MPDWSALFGEGSTARELLVWQVLGQIVSALISPMGDYLTQLINADNPLTPLAPPDLADMVVRNIIDQATAAGIAKRSGVSETDFGLLVVNTGQAPDLTTLLEGWRRKVLPWAGSGPDAISVEQGIREGHLRDKWIPLIQALGTVPIGVADAVDAVVENQISYADGEKYAYQNGLDTASFKILTNTRGNPPSPTELFDLLHRGVIGMDGTGPDATTVTQGLSESALKDKWIPAFEQLATVLPPPRTVTALQRNGTITPQQAYDYYVKSGLDQYTAQQYVEDASHTKTASTKELAVSDIHQLYDDRAIDSPTAAGYLAALNYTDAEAGLIITIWDLHQSVTQTNLAISRIKALYIARKIDVNAAVSALGALGVPGDQQTTLFVIWDIERENTVRLLSESQIVDAWYYLIMTSEEAISELQALGYTAYDAWVLLSVKVKGPIPGQPAGPPPPPQPTTTGA